MGKIIDKFDLPPYGGLRRVAEKLQGKISGMENDGVKPTGAAGGDLSGTYPDPTIGEGKVVLAKLGTDVQAKLVTPQATPSWGDATTAEGVQANLAALAAALKTAGVLT